MRWPWSRRRNDGLSEAERARRRAESQRGDVDRLVRDLAARRARNNFAPQITKALRGQR